MEKQRAPWRNKLYEIIFEADTPAGKWFDVALIISILISVFVVMIDSVPSIHKNIGSLLYLAEWFFTLLFTVEYILRLTCAKHPGRYSTSFFGTIDLISVIPTYVSLLIPGTQYLLVVRVLRVLRIFRVLKLGAMMQEMKILKQALMASRRKIFIFLSVVVSLAVVMGSFIYLIEGPKNGFTSIPRSIYWAIVTLTTVGYGDISPHTPLGQFLASIVMILGYSIIAVPSGIVTVHLADEYRKADPRNKQICPECHASDHDSGARHCKFCGGRLEMTEIRK